jgi:hypothetical protein
MRSLIGVILLASYGATAAGGQAAQTTHREIAAVRVTNPPKIDGKLDDECWKTLPSSSGFSDESLGTIVKDQTTIWVGYDDKNIYVAYYCRDAEPKKIVARETKRGTSFRGEDRVRFRLNPFNSKRGEDESEINVNPLGTQFAEFAGGRATKQEWEGIWQSAARIVEDGWTVEMAFPWRSFVRPATNGRPTTLGINFERYQARTQVYSYWSNLGVQEHRELGGQWIGVVMPPPEKVNPLSILAYSYGGYNDKRPTLRAGLDARYQFTPALTGVGSMSPDFSTVEGAVTSIDFSYAEKLPEERRPFFLEGSSYFRAGSGFFSSQSVLPFTSIRVPDFDTGAKFYGRIGQGTDVGILSSQSLRGRNDSVITVRQQLSPLDSLGIQAVGLNDVGLTNQVLVGTGRFRRGDWNLSFVGGGSADRDGGGSYGTANLFWNARTWNVFGSGLFVGSRFQARDGYVPFQDEVGAMWGGGYDADWRTGLIRNIGWDLQFYDYKHTTGRPFQNGFATHFDCRTEKQLSLIAEYTNGHFEANHDHLYTLGFRYPSLNKFQNYGLTASWGKQDGSAYSAFGPAVNWRFFNRLSIGALSEIVHLAGTQQQDIVTVAYDLSRDQGIGGRLVRLNGKANWYLSYRKSGYAGTEYFLILGDPNTETFSHRLVLKVVKPI